MSLVTLSDRYLWVEDTGGAAPAVVFLHSASGGSVMFEKQLPAVRASGFRFIAYDRVGWGRSTLHATGAPGTAADDLEALRQHLQLERVHLVGTAAGGIVALDYALTFPQRLRSLVVANSIGGLQDEDYLALQRRLRPSPQFEALNLDLRELGPSYRAVDVEGSARWLALSRQSQPASPPSPAQTFRNRLTFAALEAIRVPTLLITGDADLYCPPSVLRLFAARIRGAETVVLPETGHSGYWEQPDLFNRAVLEFVTKH